MFEKSDKTEKGSVGAWGMKNYYGSETELLAQLEVLFEDGTNEKLPGCQPKNVEAGVFNL